MPAETNEQQARFACIQILCCCETRCCAQAGSGQHQKTGPKSTKEKRERERKGKSKKMGKGKRNRGGGGGGGGGALGPASLLKNVGGAATPLGKDWVGPVYIKKINICFDYASD